MASETNAQAQSNTENPSTDSETEMKASTLSLRPAKGGKGESITEPAPQEASHPPTEIDIIEPAQPPPEESDNDSAKLKRSAATASTRRQDETPFEQLVPQIRKLCDELWPRPPSKTSALPPLKDANRFSLKRVLSRSGSHLGKVIRSKASYRVAQGTIMPQEFGIERMKGGSYNRVIAITLPSIDESPESQYVLRIPRSEWHIPRPDRDVAILRYVRDHSSIPVADVKACDFGENNPLKGPYVVQTRIPGIDLQDAHLKGLTSEQWIDAARGIGQVMREMQSVQYRFPGRIEANAKSDEDQTPAFIVRPFEVKSQFDPDWDKKHANDEPWSEEEHERLYSDTFHFLATQFARWRAIELQQDPHRIILTDIWKGLTGVADNMDTMKYLGDSFGDNQNCLAHLDFQARNIMVEIQSDQSLKVTGVLDWDSAVFAPRFVGCAPLHWMWADEELDFFDEMDEKDAKATPKREQDQRVKKAWEEAVGDEILRYAYEPHFQKARKLFHLAVNGMHSNWEMNRADGLIKEWTTWYREFHERVAAYEEGMVSDSDEYEESQEILEPDALE